MRNIIVFSFSVFLPILVAAQSTYSTNTNRVILTTIVNSDTLIFENLENQVRINGELDLFEVEYNHLLSRMVSEAKNVTDEKADITITFRNEYAWLDERIKTTENSINFKDEIIIDINGNEQTVPVNFVITQIRGGHGFNVYIEVKGKFSTKGLETDYPSLKFESGVFFDIFLTVQVIN